MRKVRILVLNGPNLGYIGVRQPEIYGSRTIEDLPEMVRDMLGLGPEEVELQFHQANSEGHCIDRLEQAWKDGLDGVVLNAGAYTHTSLALADCLAWIGIPTVEVHISNIFARTDERAVAPEKHDRQKLHRLYRRVRAHGLCSGHPGPVAANHRPSKLHVIS